MQTYHLFIADLRYMAPTLRLITVADDARALLFAEQALAESADHVGAEVYLGSRRLFGVGSLAARPEARGGLKP